MPKLQHLIDYPMRVVPVLPREAIVVAIQGLAKKLKSKVA